MVSFPLAQVRGRGIYSPKKERVDAGSETLSDSRKFLSLALRTSPRRSKPGMQASREVLAISPRYDRGSRQNGCNAPIRFLE